MSWDKIQVAAYYTLGGALLWKAVTGQVGLFPNWLSFLLAGALIASATIILWSPTIGRQPREHRP